MNNRNYKIKLICLRGEIPRIIKKEELRKVGKWFENLEWAYREIKSKVE